MPPWLDVYVRVRTDDASAILLRTSGDAFSLYLRSRTHHEAIITLTEEGQLVLGLSMDDPKNDPQLLRQAAALMTSLIQELGASSGIAGVELPPPQSTTEWDNAELVLIRQENH